MARAKVTHSDDAVQVTFKGDKRSPEPSTGVIQFPGGHVEVSRCSDGTYWVHLQVVHPRNTTDSRIEYSFAGYAVEAPLSVGSLPNPDRVQKIALRVANTVPHFDPDA